LKCTKTSFANEKFALEHIEKIKKTSVSEFQPNRAYLCSTCNTWHLTSRFDEKLKRINELKILVESERKKYRAEIKGLHQLVSNMKDEIKLLRKSKHK